MAFCLLEGCASAQWYLFPGKKKAVTEQTTTGEAVNASEVRDTTLTSLSELTGSAQELSREQEEFVLDMPEVINVTLAIPMNASSSKPSSNFLEMYCGALMAVRDLASDGLKISLQAVDTKEGTGLTDRDILSSDVLIGPVSYDEVLLAATVSDGKAVVSPLEPKTAALVDSMNVVQSPTSWMMQINELVDWISEEMLLNDEIIVIKDSNEEGVGEQARYLLDRIDRSRLRHTVVSSLSEAGINRYHNYRILIASDRDAFITSVVRAVGIAGQSADNNVTLYCTSRVRSAVGSNIIDLHNASTRLTASYHIDYDNAATKSFILSYRALFNDDPSSFAFQGYDAVKYYVRMCSIYGRQWYKKLPERSERGLQADFRFSGEVGSGKQNVAIRRVIYNKDLSTTLK